MAAQSPKASRMDHSKSSSSKASFMGLPTEIRLRIYRYLFDPSLAGSEHKQHALSFRCPHPGKYVAGSGPEGDKTGHQCIACGPTAAAQILSTCRTVFNEAMPILYESIQINFKMPEKSNIHNPDEFYRRFNVLNRLPEYGLACIKKLAIFHDTIRPFHPEPFLEPFPRFWAELSACCPQLEAIGIQIQMHSKLFDHSAFDGVGAVPNLKEIGVCLHSQYGLSLHEVAVLQNDLCDYIIGKGREARKDLRLWR